MLRFLLERSSRSCFNINVTTKMVRLCSATAAASPPKAQRQQTGPGGMKPVYKGSINTQVKSVKVFSLTTSAITLALQPFMFEKLILDKPIFIGVFVGVCSLGFLATPLLLHYITKRYVVEMRFSPESRIFEADTYSLLLRRKTLRFTAVDVNVPGIPGPITSFVALGQPLFINNELFTDADAYEHLLGYDKPLDLRFNEIKSNPS